MTASITTCKPPTTSICCDWASSRGGATSGRVNCPDEPSGDSGAYDCVPSSRSTSTAIGVVSLIIGGLLIFGALRYRAYRQKMADIARSTTEVNS